jgi:hypothetical protein
MGPRAGLDGCGKSRPPPGFDHRTVQAAASRYTDWAMPANFMWWGQLRKKNGLKFSTHTEQWIIIRKIIRIILPAYLRIHLSQ